MTIGELDLHLIGEGRHERLYELLGAHVTPGGVSFAVWAPEAAAVSVVGDFNDWDETASPLSAVGVSGVWHRLVPDVEPGARYKYAVRTRGGDVLLKTDPLAFAMEEPPSTASVVFESAHEWGDAAWLEQRAATDLLARPLSIYELHLGSWRDGGSYRELGEQVAAYAVDMGFTHVELMPVMEHPFGGSWGYQVSGYFAPTARFGDPDGFRAFVDTLHRAGIGVILDWVPAHFPRDAFALARFDGTALYEHEDPRKGEQPDWGTLVFNYGRNEVRNFLLANALYWVEEFHADGLRVDAVASMLYLDYSRADGQWLPNEFGGRENLEAVAFLKELNEVLHTRSPGVLSIAEESTAWPGVSRPVYLGGLGFGYKWNMGWMHDTLAYFQRDSVYRKFHHHELTFSLVYAWNENFILPLSHDEVVHGKGSMIRKLPGDRWQRFANLRSLYAYMWAHPGKKLVFMGGEIAQESEWDHDRPLDWHLLEQPDHKGVQMLVCDLNRLYVDEPALWELDHEPAGFRWLEPNDAAGNTLAFARFSKDGARSVVCICNFSPSPREAYRVGLPVGGAWREAINTDSTYYGGSNVGSLGEIEAEEKPWNDQPWSAKVTLPPLGVVWLVPESHVASSSS